MNSDNLAQLLRDARKKDEDARLLKQGDDLYLESSAIPPSLVASSSTPIGVEEETSLLETTALAPMPDMHVTTLYNLFLMHHVILLTIAALSFPIYYFSPVLHIVVIALLPIASVFCVACYLVMQLIVKRNLQAAIAFMAGWIVCLIVIVGTISNLLQNTAPIQLVVMLFAETVAMIAYCKLSPRQIKTFSAACYMAGAALLVWAASIASFIVERDWPSALVILFLAALFTAHHTFAIHRHASYSYNSSWQDALTGIVQFYKFWPELVNLND